MNDPRERCEVLLAGWLCVALILSAGVLGARTAALLPPDLQGEQARAYLEQGQLEQAETLLSEIIKSDPENFEAHHLLGLTCAHAQRLAEAMGHLEKAVKLNPASPEALKDLGDVYLRVHKREKAISLLARSLSLKPGQPTTQYSLGMLFLEAADYKQAASHLEQARTYGLKHSGVPLNLGRAYLNLKRLDEALDVLKPLLGGNSGDWRMQLDIGKMLFENLLYEDAEPPLSHAWELNPESYEAGFYKALVDYLLGKQAESLKVLLELRAKGAASLEVQNLLGAVYAKMDQTDEAVKILKKAMEQAPDQPDAYLNLGLILLEQGQRKEAEAILERGGALFRKDAKIFYILGNQQACLEARRGLDQAQEASKEEEASSERAGFYRELGKVFQERFHYATAAELLQIAWELGPNNPDTLLALGISCFNLDDSSSSVAVFRRAVSLRPDFDKAHYFLGNSYASLGKDAEAVGAYRQAIRLAPQNHVYYFRLGKALFRLGQIDVALAAYRSALSLSPNNAPTHCAIGRVYLRLKQDDLAFSEFQDAVRIDPGFPEPYYHLAQYYARKRQPEEAQKFSEAFARKTAIMRRTPGQYAYVRARE